MLRRIVFGTVLCGLMTLAMCASALALSWQDAAAGAGAKLSPAYSQRVQYVRSDGLMEVIVQVKRRDALAQAALEAEVTGARFYEVLPAAIALVTPAQLRAVLADTNVRYVEPDYPMSYTLATSAIDIRARGAVWNVDPPNYDTGYLGALSSAVSSLDTGQATGKGVASAVIDSGVDRTHHDFSGFDCPQTAPMSDCDSRIKHTEVFDNVLSDDFGVSLGLSSDAFPTTDWASGHGTHVAGIIAGNGYYARAQSAEVDAATYGGDGVPVGIAPQADIVSVKSGDTSSAAFIAEGLDWVAAHAPEYGIRTANISAGCVGGCAYDPNGVFAVGTKADYDAGVLVSWAAGNDGGGDDGAAFGGDSQSPYGLSVASYDNHTGLLSSFSSRGSSASTLPDPATYDPAAEAAAGAQRRPDVAAPGENIWSARNLTGGDAALAGRVDYNDTFLVAGGGVTRPYALLSGTSMATPHVTGAATLLFSACPDARPLDVMRALMASARPDHVLTTDGTRLAAGWEVGYGAIDVLGALQWMQAHVPPCMLNQPPTAAIADPGAVSADTAVAFSGAQSADPDGHIVSYAWDFGDGATAAGATASHLYTWAGTYTVSLRVTDDAGATSSTARTVTVTDDPAPGLKRVYADGLSRHKCVTSAWSFSITKLASAGDAPKDIVVSWGDGSRERVALAAFKSGRATYTSTAHLGSPVSQARADVPSSWGGLFALDSGPC